MLKNEWHLFAHAIYQNPHAMKILTHLTLTFLLAFQTVSANDTPRVKSDIQQRAENLKNLRWGMFICWSFSTFSGKEWTPGIDDVSFFKATDVDTDQWARTAKEAGMGYILMLLPKTINLRNLPIRFNHGGQKARCGFTLIQTTKGCAIPRRNSTKITWAR